MKWDIKSYSDIYDSLYWLDFKYMFLYSKNIFNQG